MPRTYLVGVKGESFFNADGTSRQSIIRNLRSGDAVRLIAEPNDPNDRWAVKVLTLTYQQIGYLPSDARDADALLKGEPISAVVHAVRGGTNWFYRFLGKKHVGVVLALTKDEPDWDRRQRLEQMAQPFDRKVEQSLTLEHTGDADACIVALRVTVADIIEFTLREPEASAHRQLPAPIDRLSLLLERQKRYREALEIIHKWTNALDPVQPTKAVRDAIFKRSERLKKRLNVAGAHTQRR